jgi:N-acetylglucosamine-6-phosphate deacetylase
MAAAGAPDGAYDLGGLAVTVTGGVARLDEGGAIAGSTLTQDRALRVAIERTGLAPAVAVEALTLTPARVLGIEHEFGYLKPGFAADAVLLDHDWRVTSVWGAGRKLH